ncbi:MAG: ribbon-helix-helix domain-containing protein [Verrucomicrobia bacterium]|nr:ribbon-helix-helix domain-containing protein [Verrucomicrobiota bacterium]
MKTAQVTFRLPEELLLKTDDLAKQANLSRSKMFREAADYWVNQRTDKTAYDLAKHLCGKHPGAPEASTSKAYLERFGRE